MASVLSEFVFDGMEACARIAEQGTAVEAESDFNRGYKRAGGDIAYYIRERVKSQKAEEKEFEKEAEERFEGRGIVIPVRWKRHCFPVRFTVELPLCKEPCCSEEIEEGRKKTIEYVLERLEG